MGGAAFGSDRVNHRAAVAEGGGEGLGLIDPVKPDTYLGSNIHLIQEKATTGMEKFTELMLRNLDLISKNS